MDANSIDILLSNLLEIEPGSKLSIVDVLNDRLIRFPKARHKRIASQTTGRPAKKFLSRPEQEQEEGATEKMEGLIFCPTLLDRSMQLATDLLGQIVFTKANLFEIVFATYLSPKLTPSFCTPELFSEHDAREYCSAVLSRPALAAMHLVKTKKIPQTFVCTDSNTDLYVTSGFKKKGSPIADSLLIKGPYKEAKGSSNTHVDSTHEVEAQAQGDEGQYEVVGERTGDEESGDQEESDDFKLLGISPDVLMTMETKTSTALTDGDFNDVVRFKTLHRFKSNYIMPFVWPEVKGQKIKRFSKMLAQVRTSFVQAPRFSILIFARFRSMSSCTTATKLSTPGCLRMTSISSST